MATRSSVSRLANDFEMARQQQIALNKERLAQLNISAAFSTLQAAAKPAPKPQKPKAPAAPSGPIRAPSARIRAKNNRENIKSLAEAVVQRYREKNEARDSKVDHAFPAAVHAVPSRIGDKAAITEHNLRRVREMSVDKQIRRIGKITNITKLEDLIETYTTRTPSPDLLQLAKARLEALIQPANGT